MEAWVRIAFDGGDLVMARLTRRHQGVVVHTRVGPVLDGVYPTAARVAGLGRFAAWGLGLALQARYGRRIDVQRQARVLVVAVGMGADQLRSGTLQMLLQMEHGFEPPLLRFERGRVEVHLRPLAGTDPQRVVERLVGVEAAVLPRFDASPWDGLVPSIPRGKARLGLRPPPATGPPP